MEKRQFFQWSWIVWISIKNKTILKKDLMNLIETNHQINIISIILFQAITRLKAI